MKKKLFTLLTLLLCLCSGAWADKTHGVTNPTTDVSTISDGVITIQGEYASSKKVDNSNQKTYVTNNAPLYIMSTAKNIKSVTLTLAYTGNGSGTYKAATIKTMGETDFSTPASGVTATLDDNSVGLTDILINNNNTSHQTLVITCSTLQSAVSIEKGSAGSIVIKSVSVTYDDAVTAPSLFSEGHITGANTGTATNGCSWGTFTVKTGSGETKTVDEKTYYKRNSDDVISYNLASGETLAAGDVILVDFIPGTGASKTTAITLTNGPAFSQKTGTQTEHNFIFVIPTGNSLIGASSFSFSIRNNDTFVYGVKVYHATTPSAPTHTITLNANGGSNNGEATATEGSETLTSITAPTRDGYALEGYYAETTCENKVATAAGDLQPNTAYTNANSEWTSTSDEVSLYAKWEAVELANTTGSKTWKFDDTNITSGTKTAASSSTEYVYSSISGMTFGNDFDATALSFKGGYPYYSGGGQTISQGSQWKFHPTVDGRVKVSWYSAGGAEDTRYLSIGGTAAGSTNNTAVTSDAVAVSADADVVIAGYSDESLETAAYIDVTEIAFTATPYTLTYNSNGATNGSVPETAKKYAEGDEVTVLGNTGLLEKDGKTFAGWNTQADGLGTDYAADAILTIGTADVTLYAKWTSEYTVTHTLTNVTKTSGEATAYENTQYTAVFAAAANYDLPEAITVTAGGTNITASCTWTKATGTVIIPAAQVTGNIEITVTGVEHVAPTAGVIYSLTTNSASLSSVTLDTEVNLVPTYATISGGGAYLGNQKNSENSNATKAQVNSSNGIYLGGNDAYIKLILNEPLKTGDVITFVNGDGTKQICFTTTDTRATTNSTSSYSYTCAEAFNDNSTIYIWRSEASATYVKSLTITRKNSVTLNNKSGATYGFSTFCSPNNFTVTGATAYKASLDEGKLNLTEIEGIIPAGAGVILAGEPGATVNIAYTTSDATADMEGNALSGTTARTETATLKGSNTYFYAFQNTTNTFKEYTGTYFPANKAYVVSNTATSSREMTMEFGETTGISNLIVNDNANIDANAPMYNLAGQKVSKNYKGIVIVNGKKYVRK